MSDIHTYTINGSWNNDDSRLGNITGHNFSTAISIGTEMHDAEKSANPEELLLGAAAGCYLITLAKLLKNRKIPFQRIELESQAIVEDNKGLRIDRIIHRPHIFINDSTSDSAAHDKCATFAHHAEHACMVSSALRGNVAISVEPRITKLNP